MKERVNVDNSDLMTIENNATIVEGHVVHGLLQIKLYQCVIMFVITASCQVHYFIYHYIIINNE